jgi:hypothetical protein
VIFSPNLLYRLIDAAQPRPSTKLAKRFDDVIYPASNIHLRLLLLGRLSSNPADHEFWIAKSSDGSRPFFRLKKPILPSVFGLGANSAAEFIQGAIKLIASRKPPSTPFSMRDVPRSAISPEHLEPGLE